MANGNTSDAIKRGQQANQQGPQPAPSPGTDPMLDPGYGALPPEMIAAFTAVQAQFAQQQQQVDQFSEVFAPNFNLGLGDARLRGETGTLPQIASQSETRLVDEEMLRVINMDPETLSSIQVQLFAGGFYDRSLDLDEIGDMQATFKAWGRAVEMAAYHYAAGKKMTVEDVIASAVGAAGGLEDALTEQRPTTMIKLANPEDLAAVVKNSAQSILGRKATVEEQRAFAAAYQGMQRRVQEQAAQVPDVGGGQVTVTGPPDPSVAAENFVRRQNPTEAGGMDMFRAYQGLKQQLFGGRG